MVVLVDDPAEVGDQRRGTGAYGGVDPSRGGVGDGVERRHHQEAVAAQVGVGVHHVHPDPEVAQRGMHRVRPVEVADVGAGVGVELAGPPRLVVHENCDVVVGAGADDLVEPVERPAQLHDLPPDPGVGARVGDQGGVELLGPGPGRPPLEEEDAVGAARDVLHAVAQQLAGLLRHVAGLPVDRARRLLHQQPRPAAGESTRLVGAVGQLAIALRVGGGHVVVVGDDVDLGRPAVVVELADVAGDHEVGGDRYAGGELVQHVALGDEVGQVLRRRRSAGSPAAGWGSPSP